MDLTTKEGRAQFYASEDWRNLRAFKLRISPLCQRCLKKSKLVQATEVHHIVDIATDPSKVVDFTNLEALCKSCHSSHTFKETRKRMSTRPRGHIKRLYNLE